MERMVCISPLLLMIVLSLFQGMFARAQSQQANTTSNSSWPHVYPGMPIGEYSPEWQKYFRVTDSLPNVTWPLSRNWAGNIPVQREGHPNNTLFFWAFEHLNGSFTSNSTEPWGIWLNGGPGSSSLIGLLVENGPLRVSDDSLSENKYAWTTIADHVWVDQPVGTGYSTADENGNIVDEDQMGSDFMGFLENFVKVFPNLAQRPLYIIGESYAGVFIPYITKAYFEMAKPPVDLRGIAIGNGFMTSNDAAVMVPVITLLQTYPQIIKYDPEVFEYFKEQSILCGYNLTLQYPQPENFPTLNAPMPFFASDSSYQNLYRKLNKQSLMNDLQSKHAAHLRLSDTSLMKDGTRENARKLWKRDLLDRGNGTIDPWYQCDLYDEMIDYALNFTFPWSVSNKFDIYDVPDALNPEVSVDPTVFLNDPQTRAAIHAPTSKDWVMVTPKVFANDTAGDPSVEPMAFLNDLATNATKHGVKFVIYSGNDDSLLPHFGSQLAIQNMTFGGIQGFTRKPSTVWHNDAGQIAGIAHQERNVTYVLVDRSGHLVPSYAPDSALVLAREFIFGHNQTGLVTSTGSGPTVIGGESHHLLDGEILSGQPAIYYGSATTASSYFFPSATVQAWDKFIATAAPTWVVVPGH